MKFLSRLRRLERATSSVVQAEPSLPTTVEDARREIAEIVRRIKARQEEIDAALAGDNPRQRAWAKQQTAEMQAANAAPEAQMRIAETTVLLKAFAMQYSSPSGFSGAR